MLHPVPQLLGPQLYCGPTAICAITGLHQYDVLGAVHHYTQRSLYRPVIGMTYSALCGTMALLGWRCEQYEVTGKPPTLSRFVKDMGKFNSAAILNLTGHWASITYDEYVCNHTAGRIVPISCAPNARTRVKALIEVYKL